MRPTFVHVLAGLLLGTALAGLLNVPGQVVAQQESVPPVRSPLPAKPRKEIVVHISPRVERGLAEARGRRAKPQPKPRIVVRPTLVRTTFTQPLKLATPPAPVPKPKPAKPRPASPPGRAAPKVVLRSPQPPPPPAAGDDEDDEDDGDHDHGDEHDHEHDDDHEDDDD